MKGDDCIVLLSGNSVIKKPCYDSNMNIVLAGGSGFIGTQLAKKLLQLQHTVIVIDTVAPAFTHEHLYFIACNIAEQPLPYNVLDHTDAVINLVGATIAQKWTPEVKKIIFESRSKSTQHITESIISATSRPSVFICASAVGFYGQTIEAANEQSKKGQGFLSDVVEGWEKVAHPVTEHGVRLVHVRTAPVLGRGGFLAPIFRAMKFGFVPSLAGQDGFFPWIHIKDIVDVYIFALETSTLQGIVNATAPEVIRRKTFDQLLARVFHKKFVITAPAFITKMIFGEELVTELTKSTQVVPERLLDKGFVFSFPTAESALRDIYETN